MLSIYSPSTDMTSLLGSCTRHYDLIARLRLTALEEVEGAKRKRS